MSTENNPEIQATWTRHDNDSWEVRVEKPGQGGLTIDIEPDRNGGYKGYVREFVVQEQGKGHGTEIAKAAFALGQEHDVRQIVAEATSPATVKIMGNVLGEQVVVRDISDEAFDVAMTTEQAVTHLAKTPEGQERSLLVRADLRGVDFTSSKKPREQGEAPPKTKEQEKEPKGQTRDQESGQAKQAREIDPNKGQSRDPDDNPGTGGTPAPSPEPPTPELPTGSAAANPEAGRSLEALQAGAQIAKEVEPVHRAPEGDNPSGKGQSRDPQGKTGPERGVELEPGSKPTDGATQSQSAVQQKVQEMGGREPDGPAGSTEAAKAQSREAVIAARIKEARDAAKPAKKPGIVSRVAERVREVVPGMTPQKEKEPKTGPGLLPRTITPAMQRENDIRKALEARGLNPSDIHTYAAQGKSLTESLEAARVREQGEQTGQAAKGKTRDTGKQGQAPVTRDPSIDRLAADIRAQAAARTAQEIKPLTREDELAQQRAADNDKQNSAFIARQLEITERSQAAYAQRREHEITQIRKENPGLTLEQAGREFDRLESQRRAQTGRGGRSGPELGKGLEKGGRSD